MTCPHISKLLIQPCCRQGNFWFQLPSPLLPGVLPLPLFGKKEKPYRALGRLNEPYQALEAEEHVL